MTTPQIHEGRWRDGRPRRRSSRLPQTRILFPHDLLERPS
jgi:hypothetical protein